MTDTNTLAPADAEILDAAEDFRSQYTHGGTTFDEFDFARAVLAKWGQPAPASQPVAVPAQAGEPWYGHKFKEQHRGIWRCECGKTVKETTADWLDMSADELRNLRTETAALCADYDAARAVLAKWGTPQPTQAQAGAVPLTCEWTHNDDDGFWETACGEAWRFDDGGPGENNMHFCHSCGKSLRIKGGQHGAE